MSWTYDLANNPRIARVRLLIADTDSTKPIFDDEEIEAMYQVQAGMFYGAFAGRLPKKSSTVVSPLRVAALLLDSLAANKARIAVITKLLDVSLSPASAAKDLHAQAEALRELDDNSGSFALVEQSSTGWAFADIFLRSQQRGGA